ncbi:MAG: DUF177 domain-containing protein [Pseudomonadota bacterium]
MSDPTSTKPGTLGPRIAVDALPVDGNLPMDFKPDAAARAALAEFLGIPEIRKLRLAGELRPEGTRDWRFVGALGATVVQPCGVTLVPVVTRIDEPAERLFLADPPAPPEGAEAPMPDDDSVEALGREIDLGAVLSEALALALPAFPRAPGAELGEAVFTEAGKAAMTDDDARPFAGLAALRAKIADKDAPD